MGSWGNITTKSLIFGSRPALTGGWRFDQCPAPFAGRAESRTLRIAPAFPRNDQAKDKRDRDEDDPGEVASVDLRRHGERRL